MQYGGSAIKAYKGWLFGYIDGHINVNTFVVSDQQKFASPPRSIGEIIAALGSSPVPVPTPRHVNPPANQGSSVANNGQPGAGATTAPSHASTTSVWRDPLDTCTLRTAGLASVTGAKFGMTRQNGTKAHQGIDLAANPGTPLYAVANGVVYLAKAPNSPYAYGDTLILVVKVDDLPEKQASVFRQLNPENDTIGFFYAHLSNFCVKSGKVDVGTVIAKTGSSGNAAAMTSIANGAHLHFEVRKKALQKNAGLANRVDPLLFIENCTNR